MRSRFRRIELQEQRFSEATLASDVTPSKRRLQPWAGGKFDIHYGIDSLRSANEWSFVSSVFVSLNGPAPFSHTTLRDHSILFYLLFHN